MLTQKYFSNLAEHFPGLVVVYNINTGKYIYVNKSVKKLLGYKPEEFIKKGFEFVVSLVHPDDLPRIMEENAKALKKANSRPKKNTDNDPIIAFNYRMRHKNGTYRWLYSEGTVFSRDKKGKVELVMNASLDVTELKEKELSVKQLESEFKKFKEHEEGFRRFVEVVEDYAIFKIDDKGTIVTWNEGIKQIFGYEESEILGQSIELFFTESDKLLGRPQQQLEIARTYGTSTEDGLRIRKDGTTFYASVTTTAIWKNNKEILGYSKIIRDITEKREAEETIRFHAYHDVLTGLLNRKGLEEHFDTIEALSSENEMAILFLDLDRFKNINDSLGHGIGDAALKEVSHRLMNSIRPHDIIARLGGDEFIIVLNNISSENEIARISKEILDALNPIIRVQNHSLHLATSIGISLYPRDGKDIDTLLKNADTALYQAKDNGRNRYKFYNTGMNIHSYDQLMLENDLRQAVKNDEIIFHYQPIVNKKKKLIGAETLMRWGHPTRGLLLPKEFLNLAEETGLITELGVAGNQKICEQHKKWKSKYKLAHRVAMNVSIQQFSEPDFIDEIKKTLKEFGLEPKDIELEITESIAMNNTEKANNKLNELRAMGISISIDDFGMGYSSLSYLKNFPIDRIKIDQSFVRNCITEKQDRSIIKAIIALGHNLGVEIIAEGIECEDQFEFLISEGCDGFQGHLFDRALAPQEFTKWLAKK